MPALKRLTLANIQHCRSFVIHKPDKRLPGYLFTSRTDAAPSG